MAGNKRFTTDNGSHEDICLVDNLTGIEYESNFMDIVNLMNDNWNQTKRFEKHNQELSEKNENLKAAFHREKNTAMKLGMDCDKLFIKNKELEKEIEQLKQQVRYLKVVCRNELDEETLKQVMGSLGDVE